MTDAQQFNRVFFQTIKNDVVGIFAEVQGPDARFRQILPEMSDLRRQFDMGQGFFQGLIRVSGHLLARGTAKVIGTVRNVGQIQRAIGQLHLPDLRALARRTPF